MTRHAQRLDVRLVVVPRVAVDVMPLLGGRVASVALDAVERKEDLGVPARATLR
jgi:hypothetical protein